jgi:hypothetical protein
MKRLIKLFEEETGYLYPKCYLEWLQWHPKYHEWLQSKLNRLLNFEEDQKKLKKFLNKSVCVHKWKYLSGSPQNELHQCLKCGAIG